MNFYRIVSKWAEIYEPMQHSVKNGNQRFFLTESAEEIRQMPKNISVKFSPCVIMESTIDERVEGGKIFRTYPIYFFVRARDQVDGNAQAEAREEANWHMLNFLAWLKYKHENDNTPDRDFDRIDLEESLLISNVGPLEDGWNGVLLQLERMELLDLCVDKNLYTVPGAGLDSLDPPATNDEEEPEEEDAPVDGEDSEQNEDEEQEQEQEPEQEPEQGENTGQENETTSDETQSRE